MEILEGHKNKNVDIEGLSEEQCETLINNINNKVFFNQKVYCRGLSNLNTPKQKPPQLIATEIVEPKEDVATKPETKDAAPDKLNASSSKPTKEDNKTATALKSTPKVSPSKSGDQSHIPGLSKEDIDKAAKRLPGRQEKKRKLDDSVNDDDGDWNWTPKDNISGTMTPKQLLAKLTFKSATAKKVAKEEIWKLAVEAQTDSKKRSASSPPGGNSRSRAKSAIAKLELQSQN